MTTLVSLVGFQPIPNLLPIRFLRPERVVLVHTAQTQKVAQNVARLERDHGVVSRLVDLPAYDLADIERRLAKDLDGEDNVVANVTGGTKPMALALFGIASRRQYRIVYLESERNKSILYSYQYDSEGNRCADSPEELQSLITIEDYVRVHGLSLSQSKRGADENGKLFEKVVQQALEISVDELYPNLCPQGAIEIDLVVRQGNQVGLIEVKLGRNGKRGIDQINTAGGQEYFGTYTKKMVISNVSWNDISDQLELASARRIRVVQLPDYKAGDSRLSSASRDRIQNEVKNWLAG